MVGPPSTTPIIVTFWVPPQHGTLEGGKKPPCMLTNPYML